MNWFKDGYQVVMLLCGMSVAAVYILQRIYKRLTGWRKRCVKYDIKASYKVDTHVRQLMEELLIRTAGSRVHIYRFHNGADFFDGTAMKRMSCAYEVSAPGTSKEFQQVQQIPLSLFDEVQRMLLNGSPHIYKVTELHDGHYKSVLIDIGVKAVCIMPLLNNKLIVGALCVQYPEDNCTGKSRDCRWYGESCGGKKSFCSAVKHYAELIEVELSKSR